VAITDVLRPVSIRKTGAATTVPSGTLNAVTSDNSDATYIRFLVASSGNVWNLRVGSHTPSAGYQRPRVRGRVRCQTDTGTATELIEVGRGTSDYIEFKPVVVNNVMTEYASDWYQDAGYGLATSGALADLNIGGGNPAFITGATELRTAECYIDIDCRLRPDFSPEVRDAAGADQSGGTVTDTNTPTLFYGAVGYDGLPPLDWIVTVVSGGLDGPEVFSASGSGTPPTAVPVTTGLPDGAYTVGFTVRSTIRGSDPFNETDILTFTVANTVPPASPPLVSVTEEGGGYRLTWTDPGGQPWDNNYVVAEVLRTDCTGTQRIATVPDGINGSYLDLAIPQLDTEHHNVDGVCTAHTDVCDITYQVRYWGYVSSFVTLPDTIPSDLILGWPSTAASIPSGWTRVTALDAAYPIGATGTGAPVATGGATTHSHTTPGHVHSLGGHAHHLDGNTGTSNSSTTSARFNGASQAQADQPHSHVRPVATGTAAGGNSGSNNPGTTAANNLPPTREVIWISSDGSQANYPAGVLGWATEGVSGWDTDTASSGRYLKGAAAAGNGGATSGAATHTHTVTNHSHAGISHDHAVNNTGLSNPSSSTEAGDGSNTPRWLPRHTHPMNVTPAGTGSTGLALGGDTNAVSIEPVNRRLSVLVNSGGGTQTRIIGLYTGAIVDLDPLLTWCDGSNGTPDMRAFFARDAGTDSINSTGGANTHSHTTPAHGHSMPTHDHATNTGTSTTGSFEAPSFGDLGNSPTTGHTHSSADAAANAPAVSSAGSGATNSVSNVPPYHEAHFVRLDGTITGGPLPVPALKVSDYASATVPSFAYGDGLDRLATTTDQMAVVTDRTHTFPRLVDDSTPLDGGLHTVATTLSGEDATLTIGVEGRSAINALERLLSADRVYWSPLGGTPGWFAPSGWGVSAPVVNVKSVQVPMTRQPWPTTPDPSEFL
jgi:hypothetical protein